MKILVSLIACGVFFYLWAVRVTAIRRDARAFDEISAFARTVKNALRYSLCSYDEITALCENERFETVKYRDGGLAPDSRVNSELRAVFCSFVSKIGTTDCDGQLDICDELLARLDGMRPRFKDDCAKNISLCTALAFSLSLCCLLLAV